MRSVLRDSNSTISQLKCYMPAIQVAAAVIGTLAIAIIITQSLSGMGLIVLSGTAGVNTLALILATVFSCTPSKKKEVELELENKEIRNTGKDEKDSSLVDNQISNNIAVLSENNNEKVSPVQILFNNLGKRVGELIKLEAELRKAPNPTDKIKNIEQAFKSLCTMVLPLLDSGLPSPNEQQLPYHMMVKYNFGTTQTPENSQSKQEGLSTQEKNMRWILERLSPAVSIVFDLLDALLNLKGEELENKLDLIHLQLMSLDDRHDYAKSKEMFDLLAKAQIDFKKSHKKEVVFILRHPDDKNGTKQKEFIQKMKKLDVKEDLSLLIPEGLPENTMILPCPYESSMLTEMVPVMNKLPDPTKGPPGFFYRAIVVGVLLAINKFIPSVVKRAFVDYGLAKADSLELKQFTNGVTQALPELLLNAVFLGYPMRSALKTTLKKERENIEQQLTKLCAGDNIDDIIKGFDNILGNLVNKLLENSPNKKK